MGFNVFNRYLLESTDLQYLSKKRQEHFNSLLNEFREISLYKKLPDEVVPLGFPILIENRDGIKKKLIKDNIFCPIHWILSSEIDHKEFNESQSLSKYILTLPVNESIQDFIKYKDKLRKALNQHV